MKRFNIILYGMMIIMFGCSGPRERTGTEDQAEASVSAPGEAELLIDHLAAQGDYVNSRNFPSLIKASAVYEEMAGNLLIIDMRHPDYFSKGHIEGAVNVRFNDIPEYFENGIVPFEYDRIILVCYGGQISSYTSALLRLRGYSNVYSMRWGMSAWNRVFAEDFWLKAYSSDYEDRLETVINEAGDPGPLPGLIIGGSSGEDILEARYRQLFSEGSKDFQVTAEKVFSNPSDYYIINFDRKDKYEAGHIPGAVRYKPNATLGIKEVMRTIPADEEVIVYCGTGHNSCFATAYLRMIGYNARSLEYGNNAFMHSRMVIEKPVLSWIPFTEEEMNDFPYVSE